MPAVPLTVTLLPEARVYVPLVTFTPEALLVVMVSPGSNDTVEPSDRICVTV